MADIDHTLSSALARRDVLRALPALALAAPIPAAAVCPHADAHLLELGRLWTLAEARVQAEDDAWGDGPETDARRQANAVVTALRFGIAEAPVTTLDGLLVKARALASCLPEAELAEWAAEDLREDYAPGEALVVALARDVVRLTGAQAPGRALADRGEP